MRYKSILAVLTLLVIMHNATAQYITNDSLNYTSLDEHPVKKVLILTDGVKNINNPSTVQALELYNLLGHFRTRVTVSGSDTYREHEINKYDIVFYVGFFPVKKPSPAFMHDVFTSHKKIVWINSGFSSFGKKYDVTGKYGFSVIKLDSSGSYNSVQCGKETFNRGPDIMYLVHITKPREVKVIATAYSSLYKNRVPYMVKAKNFYYIADMPLYDKMQSGRYLLFADELHNILGEKHPVSHLALVRIEDVTPIRDPGNLRHIADILSERHIPFLVGVVPFYVDPGQHIYISLSQRPELVKALKYCVEKGATIVMHGVTHQYKGISGDDYEFWNGATLKPIPHENAAKTALRIQKGINECIQNGIYPLIWETPHYAASIADYKVIAKFFSSVMERRMIDNNYNYGQFFPYIINKDIYGEKVYPEDLGYVPYYNKGDSSELAVHQILSDAKAIYKIRDGYASFFFHPFMNSKYLTEIVDSLGKIGYTFADLRKQVNMVKTNDYVILSGTQKYCMNLNHSFLYEVYYNKDGKIEKRVLSKNPINGKISKRISLRPDEFYMAESMPKIKQGKIKSKSSQSAHRT